MIRIIGGKYRHLVLEQPDTISTRPTMDKVREALMSALSFQLENKVILDLFAGSGALGLESLSRGAKEAYFVDNNILAIKTINSNIKKLKVEETTHIIKSDYKAFLKNALINNYKFDIVFLDPPYKMDVYDEIIDYLCDNKLVDEKAIFIKESSHPFEEKRNYSKVKQYKYSSTYITICWR